MGIILLIIFTIITYRRLEHGIFLLFLFLPVYLIRFSLGPLPTTALEIMIGIIFIIWAKNYLLVKEKRQNTFKLLTTTIQKNKKLTIGILLFLLGATISLFTAVDLRSAAGVWKAFYVEPIILFVITFVVLKKKPKFVNHILFALILSGFITSLLAIYQHFTGFLVPNSFWANENTFRVTAWYGFPNGVGLFLAPLIPLAMHIVFSLKKNIKNNKYNLIKFIISLIFIPLALLAIIFAKSTGGLVGIAAAIGTLFIFHKKFRWPTIILGIIGLIFIILLPTSNPIRQELFLQDRSGQIRIHMWNETFSLLKDRPILGAGLDSYSERIVPYHKPVHGEGIEIFHHPHNIFLTMWVNLGIIGLIGFIIICAWYINKGIYLSSEKKFTLPIFLTMAMITILVMGLVDSPYIKNDLSVLFWIFPALLIKYKKV